MIQAHKQHQIQLRGAGANFLLFSCLRPSPFAVRCRDPFFIFNYSTFLYAGAAALPLPPHDLGLCLWGKEGSNMEALGEDQNI